MINDIGKLCRLIYSISLSEGENKTNLPYLSVYFSAQRKVEMPQTEFYIFIVLDGSIRLFTPSGILDYMPGQFFVSKIDTPMAGHVFTFSEKGEFSCSCD